MVLNLFFFALLKFPISTTDSYQTFKKRDLQIYYLPILSKCSVCPYGIFNWKIF